MTFEKKWMGEDNRNTKSSVFTIWVNDDEKELLEKIGLRLRQSKVSTIFKQCLELALAKLIVDEKMAEILLDNERKNRRSGIDEIQILKKELAENLKKNDKTKSESEEILIDSPL